MMPPADMRRLRSLVLLLGSPSDGETIAAARGIGRLLNRHGLSLHDLADIIAPDAALIEVPNDDAHWHDLALWLSMRSDALTAKQSGFVATMTARDPNGQPPSPAQLEWLHGLVERVSSRSQAQAA